MGIRVITVEMCCEQSGCDSEFAGSISDAESAGWKIDWMCSSSTEDGRPFCPEHDDQAEYKVYDENSR